MRITLSEELVRESQPKHKPGDKAKGNGKGGKGKACAAKV